MSKFKNINGNEHMVSIVMGVRYRPNFGFADKLGSIADRLLYSGNSFFNSEFFPRTLSDHQSRVLMNDLTGANLRLGPTDTVLEVSNEIPGDIEPLKNAADAFKKQIVDGILKDNKVTEILRVGYIRRFLIRDSELANSFMNSMGSSRLRDVNGIDLKFSRKLPALIGVAMKNIDDFNNVLYNLIKREEEDGIFISVDFQRIFKPGLINIGDKGFNFSSFMNDAEVHCENFLNEHLQRFVGSEAA